MHNDQKPSLGNGPVPNSQKNERTYKKIHLTPPEILRLIVLTAAEQDMATHVVECVSRCST